MASGSLEECMRAWTVDADDIRVAEDFDESLLHRTPEIDGFLRADRDDKFIVIGTKGFGKTLLLKAKRILYQREARATCLPTGVCSTSRSATRSSVGSPLVLRRLPAPVVQDLAHGDLAGDAEAHRGSRRSQGWHGSRQA